MLNSKNNSKKRLKPRNLKEALKGKLTKKEFTFLKSSFDTLGNIAIMEIPKELEKKEKIIGEALLSVNNSIETVCKKTGAHKGKFRAEPVKIIAGKRNKTALYKEYGCVFEISVGKVFFSPRLSTERKRISERIKKGEHVAALFAGVGPFPIVFAKNSKMEKAIAIELNPHAVENMRVNIVKNKVDAIVEPVLGDVKKLSEKYKGEFDRAVMPLPKGGEDFLEDSIKYIKLSGGVVHYYNFVSRENPYEVPLEQIKKACSNLGRKFSVVEKRKVRDFAPDIIQVVIDFKVWKK
ncbi:MAG: class I SAM-dependent methyltransferase family protein [archaeon]|nr:class I SAM-dependent methyltransferase family protein [archaeon]